MMYLTLLALSALQNDAPIRSYEADASTSNAITKSTIMPKRSALEKEQDNCTDAIKDEGAAGAGLGYATALGGWRRCYPL
jgi:hypothetical protein